MNLRKLLRRELVVSFGRRSWSIAAGRETGFRRRPRVAAMIWVWSIVLGSLTIGSASGQDRLEFIGVPVDQDSKAADDTLLRYLESATGLQFEPTLPADYGAAIREVSRRTASGNPYLARMTPYAYVAAEMLGADFEVVATYRSAATGDLTYRAYFVVPRSIYPTQPTFREVIGDLDARHSDGPTFVYHDIFSTSSYFLPSRYFRDQHVFAMRESTEGLTRLNLIKAPLGSGSSYLVREVAAGRASLAAVWDGTKSKLEQEDGVGERVWFVEMPTALPNDLLVCSKWMAEASKDRVRAAIGVMRDQPTAQIRVGDFLWWEDIQTAREAREALAALRKIATAAPAPVTVQVRAAGDETSAAALNRYLEAARHAVELSGTELVVYDQDFHRHVDAVWTLELIHDGAVELTSEIKGSGLQPQRFVMSFRDDDQNLAKRIGDLIHSRMHRIRYVWLYENETPTVVRDVPFSLPPGSTVKVQRISWLDLERNEFQEDTFFDATVERSDFHKFQLDRARFPVTADGTRLDFEPMSNVAYRVVLVRNPPTRPFFRVLTILLVTLLVLAALALARDLWASRRLLKV